MAPLMMNHNHARYGGRNNNNMIPSISTCNPTARDACNGGQCMLFNGGVYTCRCREGYTGVSCETS